MAGRIKRFEYQVQFDLSDDYVIFTYEPETADAFATIEISDVIVQVAEFDGLINALIEFRDKIRQITANDAESEIGGQRTTTAN